MKQNIELEALDNYEFSRKMENLTFGGDIVTMVYWQKKKGKTFDFYVDEYLRSDYNTTNDMLCNWFDDPQVIEKLKYNLKQNKLEFVPWEVKIGLVKFICKDINVPHVEAVWYSDKFTTNEYPNRSKIDKLKQICPDGFIKDLLK